MCPIQWDMMNQDLICPYHIHWCVISELRLHAAVPSPQSAASLLQPAQEEPVESMLA